MNENGSLGNILNIERRENVKQGDRDWNANNKDLAHEKGRIREKLYKVKF
jgi:hypothetical protein